MFVRASPMQSHKITCEECNQYFKNFKECNIIIENCYTCDVCYETFPKKTYLINHQTKYAGLITNVTTNYS